MVIGGLMDSRDYKTVRKFPFLGDIPVIGEFFKYTTNTKDNQELIILVTPHLVGEYETNQARMTPDMEKYYNQGRREEAAKKTVDLDAPLEEAKQEETYAADEEVSSPAAKENQSMLGKYLNREALPQDNQDNKASRNK
jgi:pilus assembly protein CpaC